MTISPFDARLPSTWLTNCADPSTWLQLPTRKGCWLQNSSIHPHDKDLEDAWSQNPKVHIHSNLFKRDELGQNFVSDHKLLEQTLLNTRATCVHFNGPSNNPFIRLGLWEKKTQTHNHGLESKQNWNSIFRKPRQIPYLSRCYRTTGLNSSTGLNR